MLGVSRTIFTHHLRDCNCYLNHHYHHQQYKNCSKKKPRHQFCFTAKQLHHPLIVRPSTATLAAMSFSTERFRFLLNNDDCRRDNGLRDPYVNCIQPTKSPPLPGCLSQNEDCQESPPEKLSPIAGGIVALGKFDALHIGHRELAIQASKVGIPFLLSFVGMAEVLGWEPRAPIVAKCDRKRVLSSWAPNCGNLTPREFHIEFSKVRYLTPRQFVEKLSLELGVRGVVAGENYRFGYKAAGDASDLVRLCEEYGLGAYIISSVMDKKQDSKEINASDSMERGQVSSTRVRHALAKGDMNYASELLGRHHRLMLMMEENDGFATDNRVSAPKSCLLNLPPVEGSYENCHLSIGDENVVPCRVMIDTTHIHLELDVLATCIPLTSQDFRLLGIDFAGSGTF
ncbi:FAD synthetase 2, chloroplastic-like [Coffea arabica]|uniref:FAD synthase n=1 Tax=Coffea arabica TaxID=13443 RepID=A0ABM4W5U5_COFAR